MGWRMLLWFVAMNGLWVLAHYYVGRTLLGPIALRNGMRRRLWIVLWSFALLGPLNMLMGRLWSDSAYVAPLRWTGFAYMGVFVIVLFGSLVRDLLSLKWSFVRKLRARWTGSLRPADALLPGNPENMERRRFLANATNASLLASSGAVATWGFREAVAFPEIVEVEIAVERLPAAFEGYRIAQLSDIHVGPTIRGEFLAAVVDRVNELDPDLVAITGDLVDGTVDRLGPEIASLGRLRASDGAFFVTGNHEYYWDAEAWIDELRRLGLVVLENEHRTIERQGARLLVAGCRDYRAASMFPDKVSDPVGARSDAPECEASILLAHQPQSYQAALAGGYDLMICGHTHGGQFFPITLFVGLAHPFVQGLHRVGSMQIYVNRGTGYWGPPLRAGTRSEITLLTLRGANGAGLTGA